VVLARAAPGNAPAGGLSAERGGAPGEMMKALGQRYVQ
jgi:hypothetical protein